MLDRRAFLAKGSKTAAGLALLGGVPALLAACGSSSSSSSSGTTTAPTTGSGGAATTAGGTPNLGSASLQLSWIENVEFAGSYIAVQKGYYKAAGLNVSLVSGGPSVTTEPLIVQGKSLIGLSSPTVTGTAVNQGAPLVIIGAGYQKNPFAMMSAASKPIKTPQDMIGKTIGVQSANDAIWAAFLKINNISPSQVKVYPAQFDPTPLAEGKVDGWISYFTNEPNLLRAKGFSPYVFLFDDFGYHLLDEIYFTRKDSLTNPTKRAQVKALMTGEIRGWQEAIANPSEAADLSVNVYGKTLGLNVAEQTLESKSQNDLLQSDVTKAHGLFWMDDMKVAQTMATMTGAGIKVDKSLFTNEILQEIYQGKSSL
jgi:ABC-type nitrate/sulfonate/bicarbonate transport system substrate-binding protein